MHKLWANSSVGIARHGARAVITARLARGQANGFGAHAGREGAAIGRKGAATSIFTTAKARIVDAHSTHNPCGAVDVAALLAGACLILSRYPAWARWRSRRPSTRLAIPRVTPIAGTSTTVVELCAGESRLATERLAVQCSAVRRAARKLAVAHRRHNGGEEEQSNEPRHLSAEALHNKRR